MSSIGAETPAPSNAMLRGPYRAAPARTEERDPLAAVLSLGDRAARWGLGVGLVIALLTHGGASARALASLGEMRAATRAIQAGLHDYFWANYDVEVERPKPTEAPKPEPEPEPIREPEPAPMLKAEPRPKDDPYDPPPAPVQASKVLTQEAPKQEEKLDMTGDDWKIVSGEGTGPGYGQASAAGTGTAATYNPAAKVGGVPGGTGTGPAVPAPAPTPTVDKSKPPGLLGGTEWSCPFPPEADAEQIDNATATVVVTVRPDGTPLSVKVVSDPGFGFGRAARLCALSRKFAPALDRAGEPITGTTPPYRVRFTR